MKTETVEWVAKAEGDWRTSQRGGAADRAIWCSDEVLLASQKRHAGILQKPMEVSLSAALAPSWPWLSRVLAERLRREVEVLTVHVTPPLPAFRRPAGVAGS